MTPASMPLPIDRDGAETMSRSARRGIPKGELLQVHARAVVETDVGASHLVVIWGEQVPRAGLVLGDEHPPELMQLRQDLRDLGIRQMLQDLPKKADVASREIVGHRVEMAKADSVAAEFLPIAINQVGNDVDTDIGMTEGRKASPYPKVAATKVDEVRSEKSSLRPISAIAATWDRRPRRIACRFRNRSHRLFPSGVPCRRP